MINIARTTKNTVNICCSIDKHVYEMLIDFCEKTKLGKTAAVEHALSEYISRFNRDGRLFEREDDENERD